MADWMCVGVSHGTPFNGTCRWRVFTTLPPGDEEEGYCALLVKTMYGTEDAAEVWQGTWTYHMERERDPDEHVICGAWATGLLPR